tara:strand:+ start:1270 stop:2001 length:732 start_codon:yes stop_codon:yes gene_type:complete
MKHIYPYLITESKDFNPVDYSEYIVELISSYKSISSEYTEIDKKEINELDKIDFRVMVKLDRNPKASTDSQFNKMSWEQLNINDYGFAIDATMYTGKEKIIPEVVIHILLSNSPDLNELKFRLIDILFHEIKHVNQIGLNREPINIHPGDSEDRKKVSKPSEYFHLIEEIEAMVYGMYHRSKEEGSNLDDIFYKYLTPYINNGNINIGDSEKVLVSWITHALENYPDSRFSESKLTTQIINNI